MQGSYTYARKYSTKIKCCSVYGIFERKKFFNVFDRHANLKYKYGSRQFWCKGYYVDTVGRNKKEMEKYIRRYSI